MANTGNGFTRITAAGSAVISSTPVTVKNIIVANPLYVGTVDLYNAVAAGTVQSGLVYSVGTFSAADVHQVIPLNLSFSKGLAYHASGTPTVIVSYE